MATYIKPEAIKDGTISASKTDETIATKEELTELSLKVGDLSQLQTTEKSNLVGAINEVAQGGGGSGKDDTLRRDLGKYTSNEQYAAISVAQSGKAINANGEIINKSGYGISNEIAVTKGSIYLFKSNSDIVDVALFTQKIVADIVYSTIEETITTAEGENVTRLKSKTTAKGGDLKSHTYEFVYNTGNETAVWDDIKDNGVAKGASFVIPTQYTEYIPMFSANGMAARPISGHYCLASSVSGIMVISAKSEDLTGYLIEVRYGVVASIVNNLARKADVEVVSGLYKRGVISQTQTWANDYSGYTMSNLVWGTIPQANIDLFISAGAEFNDTDDAITKIAPWGDEVQHLPGYFYLNGLGDLSYNEMLDVYRAGDLYSVGVRYWYTGFMNSPYVRTLLPSAKNIAHYQLAREYPSSLPKIANIFVQGVIPDSFVTIPVSNLSFFGQFNPRLQYVIPLIKGFKEFELRFMFSIRYIHIKELNINTGIAFRQCPYLQRESIRFMIDNATNTSAITITLHADAYARLTEEDKAAATAKNINLLIA